MGKQVLTEENYWIIQERLDKGVCFKDIAAELGVHPKTEVVPENRTVV